VYLARRKSAGGLSYSNKVFAGKKEISRWPQLQQRSLCCESDQKIQEEYRVRNIPTNSSPPISHPVGVILPEEGTLQFFNVHAFRQLLILQFAMSINKLSEMCTWQEGNQQVASATATKSLL